MRTLRTVLLLLLLGGLALAQEREVVGRVTYVAADGIYIDVGAAKGVAKADEGVIQRGGVLLAYVQVVAVTSKSARLVVTRQVGPLARPEDEVRLRARGQPVVAPPDTEADQERPKKKDEEFVPLLERQQKLAEANETNVFHGWVSLRHIFLSDSENDDGDFFTSILGADGSLARIGGGPWAIEWSGNLSYRGGDAFDGSDLEGGRLDLFELTIGRRFDEGGFFKAGRFLPLALPAAGYFDGAQAEVVSGDRWRFGVAGGLKPTRDDLSPSTDEPTLLLYATYARQRRFTATAGVLASLFDGEFDRLALLTDMHAEWGKVFADLSTEIDVDVGSATVREGARLTNFQLSVYAVLTPGVRLRAGVDHFELLDNAAEREDGFGVVDSGTWRYRVGATHTLPAKFVFDWEVSTQAGAGQETNPYWRVALTKRELLSNTAASATLSLFGLSGDSDGIAGRLDAYLPAGRWTFQPRLGFRSFDVGSGDLEFLDGGVSMLYDAGHGWMLSGSVDHMSGDSVGATRFEFGVRYRW